MWYALDKLPSGTSYSVAGHEFNEWQHTLNKLSLNRNTCQTAYVSQLTEILPPKVVRNLTISSDSNSSVFANSGSYIEHDYSE